MAVILKIRNKLGIFIVIVIAIAILGFLVMDMVNSDTSVFLGDRNTIGEVNGQQITQVEFFKRADEIIEIQKQRSNQMVIEEDMVFKIRNQTWNEIVNDVILENEYEELGIDIKTDELVDMVKGPNPDRMIKQQFMNSKTNQFDREMLESTLNEIFNNPERVEEMKAWLQFEEAMVGVKKKRKYKNLITKAIYFPDIMAKHVVSNHSKNANIRYIMIGTMGDTTIEVNDNQLKQYVNKHKADYKQEASRTIEYVSFDVIPSSKDTMDIYNWEVEMIPDFQNADDDSMFVVLNSDEQFNPAYLTLEELTGTIVDTFFKVDTSTIIGPYLENEYFKLSKVIDRKLIPDSVKYRQILIKVESAEEVNSKRKQIDSLKKLIEDGANFATIAKENSNDVVSAQKGGVMKWAKRGELFFLINNALFYNKEEGSLFVVPGQEGFHLIEILEAVPSTMGVKIAHLSRLISWSDETRDSYYQKAINFANVCSSKESFQSAVDEDETINKRTAEGLNINDYTIAGLGICREVVRWAFKADLGAISDLFILDDQFVIAYVAEIFEEGTMPLENIRTEVEVKVRKELEIEQIKAKVEKAMDGKSDLELIANELDQQVNSAKEVSYINTYVTGIGNEPTLVGAIFGLQPQNKPKLIVTESAVFVVVVESFVDDKIDYTFDAEKTKITTPYKQKVETDLFKVLNEDAEITDKRHLFY